MTYPSSPYAVDRLSNRIIDLYNELGQFQPTYRPPMEIGRVYNALVDEAKLALPGDRVLATLQPVGQAANELSDLDAGTLRTLLTQLLSALGETEPDA